MTEKEIYTKMKLAILQRKLPPHTQLVEDALADSFEVSRTIIRAALRRLAFEKLVTIIPYKGTFVSCPTTEEALEVFEMRRVLERAAVRRACDNMTDETIKELESILELESKSSDVTADLEISANFHLKIAEATGNSYYSRYLEELISLTYVIIALYTTSEPAKHDDHLAIMSALKKHDKDLAEKLMLNHIDEIEKSLNFRSIFSPITDFSGMFN